MERLFDEQGNTEEDRKEIDEIARCFHKKMFPPVVTTAEQEQAKVETAHTGQETSNREGSTTITHVNPSVASNPHATFAYYDSRGGVPAMGSALELHNDL